MSSLVQSIVSLFLNLIGTKVLLSLCNLTKGSIIYFRNMYVAWGCCLFFLNNITLTVYFHPHGISWIVVTTQKNCISGRNFPAMHYLYCIYFSNSITVWKVDLLFKEEKLMPLLSLETNAFTIFQNEKFVLKQTKIVVRQADLPTVMFRSRCSTR